MWLYPIIVGNQHIRMIVTLAGAKWNLPYPDLQNTGTSHLSRPIKCGRGCSIEHACAAAAVSSCKCMYQLILQLMRDGKVTTVTMFLCTSKHYFCITTHGSGNSWSIEKVLQEAPPEEFNHREQVIFRNYPRQVDDKSIGLLTHGKRQLSRSWNKLLRLRLHWDFIYIRNALILRLP